MNRLGMQKLLSRIEKIIIPKFSSHRLTLPYDKSRQIAQIFKLAVIEKQKYTDQGIRLHLKSSKDQWEKIKALLNQV